MQLSHDPLPGSKRRRKGCLELYETLRAGLELTRNALAVDVTSGPSGWSATRTLAANIAVGSIGLASERLAYPEVGLPNQGSRRATASTSWRDGNASQFPEGLST